MSYGASLTTVRHVEDLRDVQCLKEQLRILGLVHGQVVEEQREVTASKLHRELAHELYEVLGVDRPGMDCEVDEAAVLTDRRDERQGLHLQVGVVDLDPVTPVGPALGTERAEREHRLVKVHNAGL